MRPILAILAILLLPAPASAQRIKLPVKFEKLQESARVDSTDAVAHYNLALGHWSRSDFDAAEESLRQSIALDARHAQSYLALSYLPFARHKDLWEDWPDVPMELQEAVRESDRFYTRAFMIDPIVDLKIMGAIIPARSVLWSASPELSDLYNDWIQGFDDFRDGRYEDAYFRLNRMIRELGGRKHLDRIPRSIVWYQALAAAHLERFDDATELTRFLLADAIGKDDPDELVYLPIDENGYRYLLAFLLHQAGEFDEAVDLYHLSLEKDFGLYMAHVRLAEIHETRGDAPAGLRERQLAVETNPDDATLLLDLGIAQAKSGRIADAKATLEEMALLQPRGARSFYFLGMLHQMRNEQTEARTAFERFLELAPSRFDSQIRDARNRLEAL